MRRVALGMSRFDEHGFPRHSRELRGDTPSLLMVYSTAMARLFGHVLRHGTLLEAAVLWQAHTPRARRRWVRSPSDLVAKSLGYDSGQDLLPIAEQRAAWSRELQRLEHRVQENRQFLPITARIAWRAARARATTYSDLQFIEEGAEPFPFLGNELHAYTDGSRISGKVSEMGVHVTAAGVGLFLCGNCSPAFARSWSLLAEPDITSDRAELYAAIGAYKAALAMDRSLVLHTDSAYVWSFMHNLRRVHRVSGFSDLRNSDLLRTLDGLDRTLRHVHGCDAYIIKVRAHNGNVYNEHADQLASNGASVSAWARSGGGVIVREIRRETRRDSALRASLPYFCPVCPERRFKRAQDLKGHITRSHPARRAELHARARLRPSAARHKSGEEEDQQQC